MSGVQYIDTAPPARRDADIVSRDVLDRIGTIRPGVGNFCIPTQLSIQYRGGMLRLVMFRCCGDLEPREAFALANLQS